MYLIRKLASYNFIPLIATAATVAMFYLAAMTGGVLIDHVSISPIPVLKSLETASL